MEIFGACEDMNVRASLENCVAAAAVRVHVGRAECAVACATPQERQHVAFRLDVDNRGARHKHSTGLQFAGQLRDVLRQINKRSNN